MKKIIIFLILTLFISNPLKANEKAEFKLYYFIAGTKCSTCVKMEKYTLDVINNIYKNKIDFKELDLAKTENKIYIERYNLYTKSIVITKTKNKKEISFKNLDKIWIYVNDENKFKNYLNTEIKNFIK